MYPPGRATDEEMRP